MGARMITGALALGLTAALLTPLTQAVSEASPAEVAAQAVADAPMVLAAAKKKASKGRLSVKVTGSGTYTVTGKGVRRTGRTSKVFKVKAGRYTVTAPGAAVKPAKVRVRAGKTALVSVRFASAGVPPAVTPVVPPPNQPSPDPSVPPGSTGEQWVEAGAPATVSAPGGYSVSIPAGVLQQRSLVTVTPQPPAEGTIPTVDVHIDGPWSGQVQVGVPLPAGASGAWPILVHDAADGTRISSGQAVSVSMVNGVPVVSASVSSLSQFQSWDQVVCQSMSAEDRAASYLCANNRDQTFQKWFLAQGNASGARLGKDGGAREHPCHYSGSTAESVGTIPFGVSCGVSMNGQSGRFRFTNDFYGEVLGFSSGAVYGFNSRGGDAKRTTELADDIPWLLRGIAESTSGSILVPGSTVQYDKPLNSAETSLVVNANVRATGLYQGMQLLAGQLGDKALAAGAADAALVLEFASCASTSLDDTVASCFTDAVKKLLASDAVGLVLGASSSYLLKKVLFWADIGSYAQSLAFAAAAWKPNPEVLLSNVQVIDPPTDRGGNDYIARDPGTGRAVRFVNGKVYDIANGGTFNCLATTRVVWDTPRLRALRQDPVGTTPCDNDGRAAWTYTPTANGGNTGTDVILRNTQTTPHSNYLVDTAGEMQSITNGGAYLCLAAANPVIWNVPKDKIDAWRPQATPARCGESAPGAITRANTDAAGNESHQSYRDWSVDHDWSPDGNSIAFVSDAPDLTHDEGENYSYDLFLKSLTTGSIVRVPAAESWLPRWSPDGSSVAFLSTASTLVSGDTNKHVDLFVRTAATGAVQRVSTAADGQQADQDIGYYAWSPDGTRIAFTSVASNLVPGDTNNRYDVFVKTLATGAVQRVSTDASGNQAFINAGEFGWSPDGRKLVYSTDSDAVIVKNLSTGAVQTLATSCDNRSGGSPPTWSPDGSHIAFRCGQTLTVRDLASGFDTSFSKGYEPAWSPDGSWIAFQSEADDLVSEDTNFNRDIFIANVTTGTIKRVSTDSSGKQANGASFRPHWSPNGLTIAFWSGASDLVPDDNTGWGSDLFIKTLP